MRDDLLLKQVAAHPYPLLFATISGAHLYGFPSEDSDFDLRGAHILPLQEVVGLDAGRETVDHTGWTEGIEVDLVTHDIKKFFQLMLKKNGYVLEQALSPLVVYSTPEHEELKRIAESCVTRHHAHHYLGFAESQWKLFKKQQPRRIKPLLYVYRVLLTGAHLMRTGRIEADLPRLNQEEKLSFLDELMEQKRTGGEKCELTDGDLSFHETEYLRLTEMLQQAQERSRLPESATAKAALNDLLVRVRLRAGAPGA